MLARLLGATIKPESKKGGAHGAWNTALAARRANSHHHNHRSSLFITDAAALARSASILKEIFMSNAVLSARSDAILNARDEFASPESAASAVSWGAIIAGAVVSSALSLALLMLGTGIGLVSVSPWSNNNVSVATFGILAAAWLIAVQLFASGVGGYLAGRLRTRWVSVHTDEVYFRDTAHGLIVWGVGAIVTAWLLTSGAASVVSGAAHAERAPRLRPPELRLRKSPARPPQAREARRPISPTCCFALIVRMRRAIRPRRGQRWDSISLPTRCPAKCRPRTRPSSRRSSPPVPA